jgi:hypothetical protein
MSTVNTLSDSITLNSLDESDTNGEVTSEPVDPRVQVNYIKFCVLFVFLFLTIKSTIIID